MEGEELEALYRKSFAECSFFLLRFSKDGEEHILGTHGSYPSHLPEDVREGARIRLPIINRELDSPRRRAEATAYIARYGSLPPCPACDRQEARKEAGHTMSFSEEQAMMMDRMSRWADPS